MSGKIGIVLGGGGGKGAYQVGVWKALSSLGLCGWIQGVSGASVGALNGAMFCAGDLDRAIAAWGGIREGMILTRKGAAYDGWFSNAGLQEMIRLYVDLSAVRNSETVFYAVASRVKKPEMITHMFPRFATARYFNVRDFDEAAIHDILLASAAIPLVFPSIRIDGNVYVDGGLKDNNPILPLCRDGFRSVIVVSLDAHFTVPAQQFPGVRFLNLSLNESSELKSFEDTFDFTARGAESRMRLGFEACIAIGDKIIDFVRKS